jgi:hypothetical protein
MNTILLMTKLLDVQWLVSLIRADKLAIR